MQNAKCKIKNFGTAFVIVKLPATRALQNCK